MTDDELRMEGALAFKARLLRAVETIFVAELGDEEGNGYCAGPALKPDTEENMLALKTWLEAFKP